MLSSEPCLSVAPQYRVCSVIRQRKKNNIWVLQPFQEYITYIEPIINQRWAKTRVPVEKPPDLLVQNLASHTFPERGSNHSDERSNV